MDVAYMDRFVWTHKMPGGKKNFVCETYGSKVIGQNINFVAIVPPPGQSI